MGEVKDDFLSPGISEPRETKELVLSDPCEFTISINKGSAKLGIDAELDTPNQRLLIVEVKEGAVLDWNKEHPEKQVYKGDYIVQVNGSRGQARQLVQAMRESQALELLIVRIASR